MINASLRIMCNLLLLDGMFYICLSGPIGQCCSSPLSPMWIFWISYPLLKVEYWSFLVIIVSLQSVNVCFTYLGALMLGELTFLSLQNVMNFFISYSTFWLKAYFVWNKDGFLLFWLPLAGFFHSFNFTPLVSFHPGPCFF